MQFRKLRILLVLFLALGLVFGSTACTKGGNSGARSAYKSETLVWWRVWDNYYQVDDIITAYRAMHPNVRIEYRKLRYDEYEQELLEALAEDRGPDIFSVHNTWIPRYQSKILPFPDRTKIPIKYIKGSIKKEEVVEFQINNVFTPNQVRKSFLDPVAEDVLMYDDNDLEKVYGLPMSMDTLVMYYNKGLMSNAGIIEPATTWLDFQEQVKKITKIDEGTGDLLVSGTALGTADNVERNFDILSLLMMQNLAPMMENGMATFSENPDRLQGVPQAPGLTALEYYMQFASPLFEVYSWNDDMPNSIEAFADGKVGFLFGYSYHRDQIQAQSPQLNFGVAPVPQVGQGQKANYASYWVETVSNKSASSEYAFDFVNFLAKEENATKYLEKARRTTALRSTKLINEHLAQADLEVSADQLLTAKSWYHGQSPLVAEEIFAEMINTLLRADIEAEEALEQAAQKVNYSLYRKL
jgi:multiple sugar transport system substrate-binding protein